MKKSIKAKQPKSNILKEIFNEIVALLVDFNLFTKTLCGESCPSDGLYDKIIYFIARACAFLAFGFFWSVIFFTAIAIILWVIIGLLYLICLFNSNIL